MLNFFTSLMVCLVMAMVSLMSSLSLKNKEKLYSFECGFNPFNKSQTPFSIQFFKILLIFLLFDMEIIVVLPLPLLETMNLNISMIIILILMLLILGLLFEWKEGSLQWLKLVKNLMDSVILME